MIKTNFHTHTVFCDGKDTCEEMVTAAIEKNFTHLGFSAHSFVDYSDGYAMKNEDIPAYKAEVARLKEKYKDKIKIYCGLELDYYSDTDTSGFDYVIASVHAVEKNGVIYEVDRSADYLTKCVNDGWNGDFYAFADDYFKVVANHSGDIIGHIDLLTKFNEGGKMFSATDKRYLASAGAAVKKLCENSPALFEINTGAISRGYRKTPYPCENILRMIKNCGGRVIITSDCHDRRFLDCAFNEALSLAKKCGFEKTQNLFL